MNVQSFVDQLGNDFQDPNCGERPANTTIMRWMVRGVRAYSEYRPLKRNYGEMGLAADVVAGQTSIVVVGAYPASGTGITIGNQTPWQETATVSGSPVRIPKNLYVGTPYQVNLSSPLANNHYAGETIYQTNMGLTIQPNVSQYMMPFDWIQQEQETFGLAMGLRASTKQGNPFYGELYAASELVTGVDAGMAQNFLGGFPEYAGSYPGLPGVPANQINLPNMPPGTFAFVGKEPTMLTFTLPPQTTVNLSFFYYALHLPETVPDEDVEAVLEYGRCMGLKAIESQAATQLTFSQGSVREDWHQKALSANKAAADALERFQTLIVNRPMGMDG